MVPAFWQRSLSARKLGLYTQWWGFRMISIIKTTKYYELHYVFNGIKKHLLVDKANMTELSAWLCVIMIVRNDTTGRGTYIAEHLTQAIEKAQQLGITCVRWNQAPLFDSRTPSIKFTEVGLDRIIYMFTGDAEMEKYRDNMP
jgi:hypothetical protein